MESEHFHSVKIGRYISLSQHLAKVYATISNRSYNRIFSRLAYSGAGHNFGGFSGGRGQRRGKRGAHDCGGCLFLSRLSTATRLPRAGPHLPKKRGNTTPVLQVTRTYDDSLASGNSTNSPSSAPYKTPTRHDKCTMNSTDERLLQ